MSEPSPEQVGAEQAARLLKAWETPTGWRYWSAVNNSAVGVWYTASSFFFFLFAGVLALMMRTQLAVPDNDLLSADLYNQAFTVHGSVMMFLFAIPIFEAIAVLLLPQMLGARDLPFPRLSAFGFWCFMLGGIFLCGSIFFDAAPRGGWFMYPPLTSKYQPGIGADMWLLGFSFIEVAAIAAAVELIVGTLKCRPPGMRINLVPLYAWYTLVAAAMVLFAFPPLIAGSMLLEVERAFGWPFFDPAGGGDPLLWQHLFWLFGHPEVYIIFLPSVALVAMMVPTFARRPVVGYDWIVLSAIGTGFLSFGLWVHHMYTTGLPGVSLGLFSAASTAVAIPTGVQLFCFLATILMGRVTRSTPMLFMFGSLAIFVLGGLTGVMVAMAPFDFQAHDSFFVVAHFHYTLFGGAVFPIIAGFYYYYPLVGNKMLSERLGRLAFWLMFIGFNVAFLPMHLTGLRGMPRRVFTYPAAAGLGGLNLVSTIGAFILAAGVAVIVWDLVRPRSREPLAPRNPWDAGTLEWVQEMPGKPWGIRSIPQIDSRYPLWDQPDFLRNIDEGRFYLPDAEEGLRETLVTSVVDARPLFCQRLPGPSFVTPLAALTTGGFFILGTFKLWSLALASLVAALLVFVFWLWTGTARVPEKQEKDVGCGLTLPLYASGSSSIGWWGVFITMLADFTAYVCLVFGYFFFWTVHADFPPAPVQGPGVLWPGLAALLLVGAWSATWLARRWNRRDRGRACHLGLLGGAGLAALGGAALVAGPLATGLDPTSHAYPAIVWLLVIWTAAHVGIGAIMHLYCSARRLAGHMTPRHDADLGNVVLYWHFTVLTALLTVAVIAGFPLLA
ncbi:cytochrome c oxidase subunit I [Nannocystis pusilla]|uniref:cytochrome-c oxidase n=1 Tax=Nannocystis pusilla TaxID=889268 RepID=A0ABS7U5E8_9BACT|nr:cytochrome c oxidase subunit I [Nannocystis pusilla]MBZ5715684.1 cytochrome c oxidase subunit I [Nannocystis pusilla]